MNRSQTSRSDFPAAFRADRYLARRTVKPIHFYCHAPGAEAVCLVGDFNHWQPWANPMERQADGTWFTEVELPHGHHRYRFLVDGQPTLDPHAVGTTRDDRGELLCLIAVS